MKKYSIIAFYFLNLITVWAEHQFIYIYADKGTDETIIRETIHGLHNCLNTDNYMIERIMADDLQNKDLNPNEIALIIIPGGEGSTIYRQTLGESGLQNIMLYIKAGGHVIGACAGAALFTERIHYILNSHLINNQIDPNTDTVLPNTVAYGPALALSYNPNHATPTAQIGSFIINQNWLKNLPADSNLLPLLNQLSQESFGLYWNGGCWFKFLQSQGDEIIFQPIINYDSEHINNELIPNEELPVDTAHTYPAIVRVQHGRGHIILMGPHPELGTTDTINRVAQAIVNPGAMLRRVYQNIQTYEDAQKFINMGFQLNSQFSRIIFQIVLAICHLNIKEYN